MNSKDKYIQSYKQTMLDELKLAKLDDNYKKIINDYNKNIIKTKKIKPSQLSKYDINNINKSLKEELLNSKIDEKNKHYLKNLDDLTKLKNTNLNNVNLYDFFYLKNKFKKINLKK